MKKVDSQLVKLKKHCVDVLIDDVLSTKNWRRYYTENGIYRVQGGGFRGRVSGDHQ